MSEGVRTPLGDVVNVPDDFLPDVVKLVEAARARTLEDVLAMLDRDIAKFKDCGDHVTAEVLEVPRAKVQGLRDAIPGSSTKA